MYSACPGPSCTSNVTFTDQNIDFKGAICKICGSINTLNLDERRANDNLMEKQGSLF